MELEGRLCVYSPPALCAFISGPAGASKSSNASNTDAANRSSKSSSSASNTSSPNASNTDTSNTSQTSSASTSSASRASITSSDEPPLENFAIYVPGLTEGLMGADYVAELSSMLGAMTPAWSLVQPILSSSYLGYGVSSLEKDAEELETLISFLSARYTSLKRIMLIGFSTGCQDMVTLLRRRKVSSLVKAVVLHSPISDRLALETYDTPNLVEHQALAREMIASGRGLELMPRDADLAPITANRFLSLTSKGGADDLFSCDFSDDELSERVGEPLGKGVEAGRVLIVFARDDEYVPGRVDQEEMAKRLCSTISNASGANNAHSVILPGNHALNAPNGAKFVAEVARHMKTWGLVDS